MPDAAFRSGQEQLVHRDAHAIGVTTWEGNGPPLLLTHGAGMCTGVFEPVVPRLLDDWSVIAIDLRGHGSSDVPSDEDPHGLPTQAADLLAVLDHLGHQRVSVFGHSYGGSVVIRALIDQPDRFDAVAVYEPAIGHPDDDLDVLAERAGHFTNRITERNDRWSDREALIEGLRSVRAFRELDPAFLDALVDHGSTVDGDGSWRMRCTPQVEAALFRISLSDIGGRGMQPELRHLSETRAPFTLLCGDGSGFRLGLYGSVAELAGVPLTVVEGHHFGPFRSPEVFADLVRRFVPPPADRP